MIMKSIVKLYAGMMNSFRRIHFHKIIVNNLFWDHIWIPGHKEHCEILNHSWINEGEFMYDFIGELVDLNSLLNYLCWILFWNQYWFYKMILASCSNNGFCAGSPKMVYCRQLTASPIPHPPSKFCHIHHFYSFCAIWNLIKVGSK